ncbi:MAG: efflux RND transporter periplasmic adaptor subunit [Alphaproteobacteria bacterium]|nr:efflux RND transporter periplasmic adaptor subunit [Alphaproteobacteria bacterium]
MIWQKVQDQFERSVIALQAGAESRPVWRRLADWTLRRKLIAAGVLVLAAVAWFAILQRPAPAEQSATAMTQLPTVVAERVALRRIAPQVALAGTVVSRNDSHIASDVEGRVAWVADVGTVVQQGDVVARLDSSVASMQLASDKANVARLAAQLRFDRAQADRMESLYSQSAIAKATRDQAISTREMDVGALAQAQAALSKSQYQHDHDEIRAPFAGRVVQRLINPGEYATAGKDIVRLVDIGSLEVSAQAPIQYSQFIHEGSTILAQIEDKPVAAKVRAIVPVGDQLSRTVEVRLSLAPGAAFVGDSARVLIPTAAPRDAVAVPRDALLLREEGTYVFKLDKHDTALRVAVETGSTEGDMVEIRGPVAVGERVVVRGGEHLEAGQKVRVRT